MSAPKYKGPPLTPSTPSHVKWRGIYGSTGMLNLVKAPVPRPTTPSFVNLAGWLVALTLAIALCCGCASANFNNIRAKGPDGRRVARQNWVDKQVWSGVCYPARVKRAHEILLLADGRPYVALYYLRCTPKADWIGTLVPRRARRKPR